MKNTTILVYACVGLISTQLKTNICLHGRFRKDIDVAQQQYFNDTSTDDSTVSMVSFDFAGTLRQKVGVALPSTAAPIPKMRFGE